MTIAALAFMSLILASSSSVSVTVDAASGFSPFGPRLMTFWPISASACAGSTAKADARCKAQTERQAKGGRAEQGFHAHGVLSLMIVVVQVCFLGRCGLRRRVHSARFRLSASPLRHKRDFPRAPAAGSGQASSSLQIHPA